MKDSGGVDLEKLHKIDREDQREETLIKREEKQINYEKSNNYLIPNDVIGSDRTKE